jgi:hypothetical protein
MREPGYDTDLYDDAGNYRADRIPVPTEDQLHAWEEMSGFLTLDGLIVASMLSEFNQNHLQATVGPSGSGKSTAVQATCHNAALRLAWHFYGDTACWRRFFYPSPEHLAVSDVEQCTNLVRNTRPHRLYVIDDCFLALDRAQWATKEHRLLNAIQSMDRTTNAATFLTIHRLAFVDKIWRGLIGFRQDMIKTTYGKKSGVGQFKFYKLDTPETATNPNRIWNIRLRSGDTVWDHGISSNTVPEISDVYKPRRIEAVRKLKEQGIVEPTQEIRRELNYVQKAELYAREHPIPLRGDKKAWSTYRKRLQAKLGSSRQTTYNILNDLYEKDELREDYVHPLVK